MRCFFLMCFFLFSIVAACDGAAADTATGTSALIAAHCAAVDACCVLGGEPNRSERCRALYADLAPPDVGERPNAARCLELLTTRTADGTICAVGTRSQGNDPCEGIFHTRPTPTRKPGETCLKDADCAVQLGARGECYHRRGDTQTCIERRAGKVGDGPCRTTLVPDFYTPVYLETPWDAPPQVSVFECDQTAGTFCDPVSERCAAVVPEGSPCTLGESCEGLTRCRVPAGESAARCTPRVVIGGACDRTGLGCVEGAGCALGVCVPHQAVGTPCVDDAQCGSGFCTNKACEPMSHLLCLE